MAKKSSAGRQTQTTRRAPAAKGNAATLVRAPGAASAAATGPVTRDTSQVAAPSATLSAPARAATRPAFAVTKPTRPAPPAAPAAPAAARPQSSREQATRIARARATQRARTANIVAPDHYSYVISDLRLTAALAVVMFLIIIVLHFVLG